MVDHVKTHQVQAANEPDDSKKDMIPCKVCNRAILKESMERHMKAHDSQRSRLRQLIRQQEERQMYTCCDMKFKTIFMLEKHKKTHNTVVGQEDKIECPECGSIITARYYRYHCQLVHDKNLLPCDKCGKQMNRASLKLHRETTCSEERVPCDICGKMVKKHMLTNHKAKVHATKKVKCRFCPKEYDGKPYAMSHERWSHREEFDKKRREGVKRVDHLDRTQLNIDLGLMENPGDQHTCPVCFNVHGSNAFVEAHVKKAHPTEYMSIVLGGIEIGKKKESVVEDFSPEQYVRDAMKQE